MAFSERQWIYQFSDGVLIKLSGVMECLMGFWEAEWGCNGIGEKPVGLPKKSMGFSFNGAVTGG